MVVVIDKFKGVLSHTHKETELGSVLDNRYLKLDGTNANTNINVGSYGITANSYIAGSNSEVSISSAAGDVNVTLQDVDGAVGSGSHFSYLAFLTSNGLKYWEIGLDEDDAFGTGITNYMMCDTNLEGFMFAYNAQEPVLWINQANKKVGIGTTTTGSNILTVDGGATISSGKLTLTPSGTIAGLNVGTVTSTPSMLSNGDVWINNSNLTLSYMAGDETRTVAGISLTQTLTNKTISFANNTLTGTQAQFDTALSDGSFAFSGGAFHDGFSDFVANEHIDHTSVILTAGEGLTGGGDISASRSFALDFNDLSTTDTAVGATDLISIHDGAQKKITFANFEGSLNHDNLTGFVTNEHIDWTNASSNFLTTGSVTGRGTTQLGSASNYVQVSSEGIMTMAGTAEYRVASDRAAFKAVADTDAGLFFGVTGGVRYYYTDVDGVEMFSIGASTAASGNLTLYGNLAFSSGNYTVADNRYAFVSTTDNDIGLFFDGTNLRIEHRDNLGANVFGVTVAGANKGALRWITGLSTDTAITNNQVQVKPTLQWRASAPSNADYIAVTNNRGSGNNLYVVFENY